MLQLKKIGCYLLLFALIPGGLYAQALTESPQVQVHTTFPLDSAASLIVQAIVITGNKKTKEYIVRREIQFKPGDTIPVADLKTQLLRARRQVYNTTLFTDVKIDAVINKNNRVSITVSLKERWYIYPLPQFQLVDRNFNEWLKLHNGDLNRVNYGVKFTHFNLTGRRDQLAVSLVNGYSRNIAVAYTESYSNAALTEGFGITAAYTQNRQVAFKTSPNNKLLFYPTDSLARNSGRFVRNIFTAGASYIIRKGFFRKQVISLTYYNIKVNDSVLAYNPAYFNSSNTHQSFIDIAYNYQYTNVNNVSYPLRGQSFFGTLTKRGWGFKDNINLLQAEAGYSKYIPLGNRYYASLQVNGKIKLPFKQAYVNQRGLGYGDIYLRGLEYYVVDGVVTGLGRATLKKKVLAFNIPLPFKSKVINTIPFTFYAKTFADAGYVYNKKDQAAYLNNRLLYTGGFGIDIVTLYDISFRVEYSFNQLNQNGLFLHTKGGF